MRQTGYDGAILTLFPVPLLLAGLECGGKFPDRWHVIFSVVAATCCLACGLTLFSRPRASQLLGFSALASSLVLTFRYLGGDPFAALMGSIISIGIGFTLFDFPGTIYSRASRHRSECFLERAWWGAVTVLIITVFSMILGPVLHVIYKGAVAVSAITGQILLVSWAWTSRSRRFAMIMTIIGLGLSSALFLSLMTPHTSLLGGITGVFSILVLSRSKPIPCKIEGWWGTLFNHPARMLLSTFFLLCVFGTLLMLLPTAFRNGGISLIDAAFTSVSAVCVTGLVVLDTGGDFSSIGQGFILLLIQLGGLGIMTITTVALHAMGRRLSLRQERLVAATTDTERKDLLMSLTVILKFTFIMETLGALLLFGFFYASEGSFGQAMWRGVFTAVSAFCNAGFALQSDSLISYQTHPMVLHTVAVLIVLGGMAPATALLIPGWLMGRPVPVAARITLTTTAVLLISGTLLLLPFEWNGVLADLSVFHKIHNAWFQSVTLRTAGFNSIDFGALSNPSLLFMICFMFIGGSPGGTAGGVKTTTIGILAMTFWANIISRPEVIFHNRRIPFRTICRAVTIIGSGVVIWFITVLMLEVTQQIPVRDILFEATSAIGTVGLSTGATGRLDEIGKVIIMIAMFVGRIGPMTLFMLLSDTQPVGVSRCPDAKISLT